MRYQRIPTTFKGNRNPAFSLKPVLLSFCILVGLYVQCILCSCPLLVAITIVFMNNRSALLSD